jgi:hypothetical protein
MEAELPLPVIAVALPLSEVYAGVDFPPARGK